MNTPAFLLLFDAPHSQAQHDQQTRLAERLRVATAPILGFEPTVQAIPIPPPAHREMLEAPAELYAQLAHAAGLTERGGKGGGEGSAFILPASFDFDLSRKQMLSGAVRETQRRHPGLQVHYDDLELSHPLLLQAFLDAAGHGLGKTGARSPKELGVLLVASGTGDAVTRSASYELMRLVWEQLGAARGDVAFVRHTHLPVPEQLEACARLGLSWLIVPQYLWSCQSFDFARTIFEDFQKQHEPAQRWQFCRSIGDHPNVEAWLRQRMIELYRAHRSKLDARQPSAKHDNARTASLVHGPWGKCPLPELDLERDGYAGSLIADVTDSRDLSQLFERLGLSATSAVDTATRGVDVEARPVFIKVTWHGYATGTYTDPQTLDAVLGALPGKAIVLEGHTASRSRAAAAFDWETEAREHRAWIKEQETDYLRRTGLAQVLQQHGATYLNVTEAFWDEDCAAPAEILKLVAERGHQLRHPELAEFVPRVLLSHRGAPFLSLARFKGPTRLGISNLFGLLPQPLRSAWHGPNITYFARVCCDMAKIYDSLFACFGMVEALSSAVRWERRGLYRSRWGNYDLIPVPGLATLGRGFSGPDILASRLQGQDVTRSGFFDVVKGELGFPNEPVEAPIDEALVRRFV